MGLLSVLSGGSKLKKPNRDQFFAAVAVAGQLQGRIDLTTSDRAGIVFNPVESSFFDGLSIEIMDALRVSGHSTGTRFEVKDDPHGTRWVVLQDRDFDDLVSTIHLVGEIFAEHGFSDRMLAAVLEVRYEGRDAHWIYNYKRGRFYPMIPSGHRQRDNNAEMRLSALMEQEKLPVEPDLERWYSLWDVPF